jgi:hypothetical protein
MKVNEQTQECQEKLFHLGDILSITTEKLVSPRLINGVYDILNFMTGDNLFTHQLLRACRECQPYLLEKHPQLKDVDANTVDNGNWRKWLEEQVAVYGECLPVSPIPKSVRRRIDALEELESMVGQDRIVAVTK